MITIGTVLFEGFELLDVFGPLEMFGLLENKAHLLLLAEQPGTVRSAQGPASVIDHVLEKTPPLDVLLIPGGLGTRREVTNTPFLEKLAKRALSSKYVATVCTGSALLAKTGLLDGKKATSNKKAFEWVRSQGPKVNWVPEARWVEDGNYFTASGISAGIDMTLALIEKIFDRKTSLGIAERAEYEWHADKNWDPFAKLNGLLPSE